MKTEFQGRVIIPGSTKGRTVVSRQGMNILATFQKSILTNSRKTICYDQNNPDLYKKEISGRILCLPTAIGSTTGGLVIQAAANLGITPLAFLFSNSIDSLTAAGVLLSDIWIDKKIITIDRLGDEFLNSVSDDNQLCISEDGKVVISQQKEHQTSQRPKISH